MLPSDAKPPLTEAQASAATALAALAIRQARGERVSQSAISEAVRAGAEADLDAQFQKRWGADPVSFNYGRGSDRAVMSYKFSDRRRGDCRSPEAIEASPPRGATRSRNPFVKPRSVPRSSRSRRLRQSLPRHRMICSMTPSFARYRREGQGGYVY